MSDSADDDRMDDLLSRALGPTRPQLDFQKWQQEHAQAVETLRSWENDAFENRTQRAAEVPIVSWGVRNGLKMAAVSAAVAVLVLVISSGVLDREDRRLIAVNGHQPKTAHGQHDKTANSVQPEQPEEAPGPAKQHAETPQPKQPGDVVMAKSKARHETVRAPVAASMKRKSVALGSHERPSGCPEDLRKVVAPLTAADPVVRVPPAVQDYAYATAWLPFSGEDIRAISIFNAIEAGSGKTLIARVPPKYHGAVFACVAGSQPPDDDSGFDCVWSRETVIELKDGRSFLLSYHGECDAPEFSLQQRATNKRSTRWSRRLKGLLRILESGKVRVRFVRLEKDQDGTFAVAGSCLHTVSLGIPTSAPDDSGHRYAVHATVEADGMIALQVQFRREAEEAGSSNSSSFDGTVRLSGEEFSANGQVRVLRSTGPSILLMTVEPHNH